jgi:hypothetical protein
VVTDYELYRNDGGSSTTFTEVTSYVHATHGFSATLDVASEGMTAGQYY